MAITLEYCHVPGAVAATVGFAVRAGSSNEPAGSQGLAHFVEHTIFKGTKKRSSWHINNRMEAVGGELNAFTTKTDTVFYTVFPNGQLTRAVELLADLAANATFPDAELSKERTVVAEEIDSYRDTPIDAVYDDFDDIIHAGTPYGHNILGSRATLRNFDSQMCRNWLDVFFYADNMVFFYAGRQSEAHVKAVVYKYFNDLNQKAKTLINAPVRADKPIALRRSHQAHTVMGCALPHLDTNQRIALSLLTNMLGGPGMNSLLNTELRERRGLVYTVEASVSYWPDRSTFTIYFGCEPDDNELCKSLVNSTISRLAETPLTHRALKAAARQYKGQLIIGTQNVSDNVIARARTRLLHGNVLSQRELNERIDALTSADIQAAAKSITSLSSLTSPTR